MHDHNAPSTRPRRGRLATRHSGRCALAVLLTVCGQAAAASRLSADEIHEAGARQATPSSRDLTAPEAFEPPATWPGQSEEPDDTVRQGFAAALQAPPAGASSGDGFAWEPTFYGPGLTREPMVATVWDDGGGPALYVGGQLLTAGPHGATGIARWDGAAWTPLGIGVNGPVRAMTVYQGDLIVAGAFTQAATEAGAPITVNRIARWDGSQWSPLGAGFPSPELAVVLALTVYEGDLIAGGAWLPGDGQPTSWIARWDGNAWSPLGSELNQAVWDLTVYDGDLIAGGSFTHAGGQVVNGIARWDGGAWSPLGSGMDAAVVRLRVLGDDLFAGGGFTEAGGVFAGRVARWDGSAWSGLGAGLAGTPSPHVRDLEVFGGELIAVGRFTHAGGQVVNHIARWNGGAWSPLAGPSSSGVGGLVWQTLDDGAVSTVVEYDGTLIAGGEFYTAGGVRANYIAAWDGGAWSRLPESGTGPVNFSRDNNASVRAITTFDGELVVGGGFDDVGVVPGAARVARWNGSQWSPLGTGIDLPFPAFGNEVNALTVFAGDLIAGGGFDQAGGVPGTSRVARWDGAAWSALGGGIAGGDVQALIDFEGGLIAAGSFTTAGGTAVERITRWDGGQWLPLGGGLDGTVNALAVYEGELIAAGSFTAAGGTAANRIARWDGSGWSPLGSGCNETVAALAVYEGELIAAGFFSAAGGLPANQIARWNGSAWSPLGGGFSSPPGTLSPRVSALTVFGGDLYAAGLFPNADGGGTPVAVNNIARWDGERWWPLAGPLGVGSAGEPNFPWLFALGAYDADGSGPLPEKLVAGGFHLVAGGVASWGLGVYAPLAFSLAPDPLDFGAVITGETGGPLGLTLGNNGGATVTVDQVSDPAAPFAAVGGTCGAPPFTLEPGASCTLDYTFSPAAAGEVSAAVTIESDAPGAPHAATLRGVGSDGSLATTPDPLAFGTVAVGESAGPASVTLINADDAVVQVSAVSAPGEPFSLTGGSCGAAPFDLAPGGTCTLDYAFSPATAGSFEAVVEVTHDGGGSPTSFALAGEGVEPELSAEPDPLDFGIVPLGEVGGPLSLTLTNSGAVPLAVSAVSPPAAPFAPAGTSCDPLPFELAPGASCTFAYVFEPIDPGAASTTVTVTSDDPTGPHTVVLQGSGGGAVLSPEPESLATTLPQGGTGTEPLTIANPGDATLEWQVAEEGSAPGPATTITHSTSLSVAAGNTVACQGGFSTLENHYLRVFDLDALGLTEGFHVREVTFGVEFLDATVAVEVNLYTLEGELTFDNLTPIGTTTVTLAPQELTLITAPVTGFAPAGSTLVVEILPPHLGNLGRFFPGSNALGESAPSYWAAPECGIPEPVPYGSAGWPGVHLVMTVRGDEGIDCGLPAWAQVAPPGGTVPAGGEQPVEVHFDAGGLAPGEHAAALCLASNDGVRPLTLVPLSLTVTEGGDEGFTAMSLAVDPEPLASDGNRVFEPGEQVEVAPAWRNDGSISAGLAGTASEFVGPDGATYTVVEDEADYGVIEPGQTASCQDTGACYLLEIDDPAPRPATHWEATFDEMLSDSAGTTRTWSLHIGDSFADVPRESLFYPWIETLLHHRVTGGCTATGYCPAAANTRGQMAVFLLKASEGGDYLPPACVEGEEVFADVSFDNLFCPWIEELAGRGVTAGCGGGNYCPNASVNRDQMAVFLLKALESPGYTPPACSGVFGDVPCPSLFANWVEDLVDRGITAGCGGGNYCPANPVSRDQMAVFLAKTFGLNLYGP